MIWLSIRTLTRGGRRGPLKGSKLSGILDAKGPANLVIGPFRREMRPAGQRSEPLCIQHLEPRGRLDDQSGRNSFHFRDGQPRSRHLQWLDADLLRVFEHRNPALDSYPPVAA